MKKLMLIAMLFGFVITASSQTIKKDASGNYVAMKAAKDTAMVNTGKTYTDAKGVVYPVYVTKNGKLYIMKVSKNMGQKYKYYLKVEN